MATWSKEVFAKNLRHYMEKRGKTQKELSEIIGVSAPTMNDYLQAKKYPRIDKIEKMADYFGVLKSDLIEDKTKEREEMTKKGSTIADAALRMKNDADFMSVVEMLLPTNKEKLRDVKQLLDIILK